MKANNRKLIGVSMATMMLIVAIAPVFVLAAFHGVAAGKSTVSPVKIGQAYTSTGFVGNLVDQDHDTIRITGFSDTVNAAGGASATGNILSTTPLVFNNASLVSCTGGTGAGTSADPRIGATSCLLLFGGSITTKPFSHYTVQPGDFNLPNNRLTDTVAWAWNNTCTYPNPTDCSTNPQIATAGASAVIQKRTSATVTDIHNAAHQVVTTVAVGTTVHDKATVTSTDGGPTPQGNVTFQWFTGTLGNECANLVQTSGNFALDVNGQVDATTFTQTPLTAGFYGFKATYAGSATYLGSTGACEPLRVVDARISITPNDTNQVNNAHTFTATVWVNDGTGETLAPNGTSVTFTSVNNFGATSTPNPPTGCTTTGGSCTTTINSSTTGSTTVTAHSTMSVAGVSLTRHTDSTGANSGPATKLWVDARISIQQSDTNQVNDPHTFTVTTQADAGNGAGFQAASGSITGTSLLAGSVGSITGGTCTLANATTPCTIIVNSPTAGTATVNASATVTVGGVPIGVATNGYGAFNISNVKTWANARITIQQSDTNQVNDAHTFTVSTQADFGDGNGFVAASGSITSTSLLAGSVGTITGGTCTLPNAVTPCTIIVNSSATGTATVNASATVTVNGVPINVATNGSGAFNISNVKTFVDARITIQQSDTNQVNDAHTFTVSTQADAGNGAGFQPISAPITGTSETGVGAIVGGTCTLANAVTPCTIIVNSSLTGSSTVNATATVTVGGVPIAVSTSGYGAFNISNVKTWVDARITIQQSDTNQVNDAHTFTVSTQADSGNGAGFQAVSAPITGTSETGVGAITGGTCTLANAVTPCTIIVNSSLTGSSTVNATATVTVGGVPIAVSTSGYGAFNISNVKTWVDARITIQQSDTNQVNDAHTFTVSTQADSGNGAGFQAVSAPITGTSETGVGAITGGTCTLANAVTPCTIIVNSSTTGSSTVNATATVTVGGVPIAVSTSGYGAFNISNVKTWVDARITIQQSDTNQVNDAHTFTVSTQADSGNGAGFQAVSAPITGTSETGVGAITGGTCTLANAVTPCTIIVNSSTTGSSTVNATATVTVGGVAINVSSTGYGAFNISNVKTFVDARITIQQSDTNQVNDAHTFTVSTQADSGNGAGFQAASGSITGTSLLAGSVGSITGGTCTLANATTPCTIIVNSAVTGQTTVNAAATVTVGGVPIAVATNGYGAFNISNVKTWVDARISITPNGTNEVGQPHTFTVTVEKDTGSGTFGPASGVSVTVTTNFGTLTGSPCTTDINGKCTVVLNSSNPGLATVTATATVPVNGVNVSVATNGYGAFTVENQKLFADANITITPNGTNEVGENHTFTVTVMKNTGSGMVAAAGEHVDYALSQSNGATATVNAALSTCDNAGANTDAQGKCLLVVSSPTTGQTVANASVSLTINGPGGTSTTLNRDTDPATASIGSGPGGSGPATKTWVDANITVTPQTATNPTNTNHTFTITVKKDVGNGAGLVPAAGETVTYNGTGVGTEVSNTCNLPTNAAGQCEVVWTSAVVGQTKLFAYVTLTITTATGSDTLTRDADSTTASVGHGPGGTDEALKNWEKVELPCPAGLFLAGAGAGGLGDLQIAYDQFPAPNDNSYGANAAGWGGPGKHTFGNLTGSDKAGFQILRPNGTIALSFNIDYLSAKAGTPSGYASLGPFGGDGGIVTNNATNPLTNDPNKITWDTSLARNLNNTGYFAGGVENAAHKPPVTNGANLLVDSPPVVGVNPGDSPEIVNNRPNDGGQYDFKDPNPWTALYSNPEYNSMDLSGTISTPNGPIPVASLVARDILGWNFHDTFFVTLKRPYLTSIGFPTDNSWKFAQFGQCPANTWCVQPNDTVLHNSPAKPCPVAPPGPVTANDISITKYELKDKLVKITVDNANANSATVITDILNLNWPTANGNLLQVKLDGDTVWQGSLPKLAGGYANLAALAGWNADATRRTIGKDTSDVLTFVFQNNAAAPTNAGYSGSVRFDNSFNVQVLPQP